MLVFEHIILPAFCGNVQHSGVSLLFAHSFLSFVPLSLTSFFVGSLSTDSQNVSFLPTSICDCSGLPLPHDFRAVTARNCLFGPLVQQFLNQSNFSCSKCAPTTSDICSIAHIASSIGKCTTLMIMVHPSLLFDHFPFVSIVSASLLIEWMCKRCCHGERSQSELSTDQLLHHK